MYSRKWDKFYCCLKLRRIFVLNLTNMNLLDNYLHLIVNLLVCNVAHLQAKKAYGRGEAYLHAFLTSALKLCGQLYVRTALPSGKYTPFPFNKKLYGPQEGTRDKISFLCGESKEFSVLQPVILTLHCLSYPGLLYLSVDLLM